MYDNLIEIINNWDPIELFPSAPQDEYELEVLEIIKIINQSKNLKVNVFGNEIRKIFLNYFGSVFQSNIEECEEIAKQILDVIDNEEINNTHI